ncbi:MAG: HipA N-terminal domain-containing protein [Bacteroidales bacterium]|nr:HipA N-terminal domain-containing protein [Bacteroidales bacterium]MBR6001805.1 HipA N-terminal domain-containing protein [Bacteroidales bacterium]
MRSARVYNNNRLAGVLTEASPREYVFRYDDAYFLDGEAPAISITLPKTEQEYHSDRLFPFFVNMLSEGHNRTVQAAIHKLDREDDFGILLATAQTDTPGTITVIPITL